jgi:hypothetical protein
MTRRRDQILKDKGKLPPDHLAGTGTLPGTENERPKAHQGTPRVRAYETDTFEQPEATSQTPKLLGNEPSRSPGSSKSGPVYSSRPQKQA